MKKILLIGFGSEIGSMLLYMNKPKQDKFIIDTVITNKIADTSYSPIESLKARLILANPEIINDIKVLDSNNLKIYNRNINIIWGNLNKINFEYFKNKKYFATILATSKKDISNFKIINQIKKISKFIFGVAESKILPSYYHNLSATNNFFTNNKLINKERFFAFGSCQSTGWTAQIKGFLDCMKNNKIQNFKIIANQLEIVHPDTPTGRLGTKAIDPRLQDARDNLRPSFSQATITMNKLFPYSKNLNTISLRTLTMPPGFQICRIFFTYNKKNRLSKEDIINSFKITEKNNPSIIKLSKDSLGSRAFEKVESSVVILINDKYLNFYDNFINIHGQKVSLIILLSYVHNTRGYCRYVLDSINDFTSKRKKFYFD